ncbi:MAG: efflux RND transporter periplasmic adaptor subunit, partial [Dehalococcoidia bacterium]
MRLSDLVSRLGGEGATRRAKLVIAVLMLPIIFAGGLLLYSKASPEGWAQVRADLGLEPAQAQPVIMAWGFIEADETYVYAETGGRIVEIAVDEGDEAEVGDVVARLDATDLDAQIEAAEAAVEVAKATLNQAEVAADHTRELLAAARARKGSDYQWVRQLRIDEAAVETAEANVRLAEANMAVLETQREQLTVRSPVAGMVVEKVATVGEVVTQFTPTPIVVVANLDELTLTIYVSELQLGLVNLGQDVAITVDSFPSETFIGEVTYISPQAEFTPTTVQTQEERVKMVFRVKVRIPNPEHRLKAGMPADA